MITQSGRTLLTLGQDSSLTSTKGFDDTTGLGTPNGAAYLVANSSSADRDTPPLTRGVGDGIGAVAHRCGAGG